MVDCVVFCSAGYDTLGLTSWSYVNFCSTAWTFVLQPHLCVCKTLTLKLNSNSEILHSHGASKDVCKSNQSLFVQEFVLTYFYIPLNNCTKSQQHVQCGMYSAVALFLPLRELKSRINICSQSCNNIYDTLNKCSAPQRGIINSLKTNCLKTTSKQTQRYMGMHL